MYNGLMPKAFSTGLPLSDAEMSEMVQMIG